MKRGICMKKCAAKQDDGRYLTEYLKGKVKTNDGASKIKFQICISSG